ATLVVEGIRADRGSPTGHVRASRVDKILDEAAAVRTALRRANPGDLVVMGVDDALGVYRGSMALGGSGDSGATAVGDPRELEAPGGCPGAPAPRLCSRLRGGSYARLEEASWPRSLESSVRVEPCSSEGSAASQRGWPRPLAARPRPEPPKAIPSSWGATIRR